MWDLSFTSHVKLYFSFLQENELKKWWHTDPNVSFFSWGFAFNAKFYFQCQTFMLLFWLYIDNVVKLCAIWDSVSNGIRVIIKAKTLPWANFNQLSQCIFQCAKDDSSLAGKWEEVWDGRQKISFSPKKRERGINTVNTQQISSFCYTPWDFTAHLSRNKSASWSVRSSSHLWDILAPQL